MLEKLKDLETKFEELNVKLSDPEILSDQTQYRVLVIEHAELEPLVEASRALRTATDELEAAREMLAEADDKEMKEMAQEEIDTRTEEIEKLEVVIKKLLAPKDPNDRKNVILEIRAGTGGEEAALFAADIFRMYTRYAESANWKVDTTNTNFAGAGGVKEVTAMIIGNGAYSKLKYESGGTQGSACSSHGGQRQDSHQCCYSGRSS